MSGSLRETTLGFGGQAGRDFLFCEASPTKRRRRTFFICVCFISLAFLGVAGPRPLLRPVLAGLES
jgi:hypothetical protein